MSLTDKYDLETAEYGTSNWNSILSANMQKIDDSVQAIMLGTSGETITAYDAICVHYDDTKIYKVITVASGIQYICLGLSAEDIAASDTEMRIYRDGIVTCSGWDWEIGHKVYLSSEVNGGLTQAPTLSGIDYQLIGVALDTTVLNIMIDLGAGAVGGEGGVSDHGALTGLEDDDHTQYHNNGRGDARYYTETELDNGQLDNRYYTESEVDALTWTESDITDLDKYTKAEVDTISGSLSSEIDDDIDTHAASSDHDNRYYTESEVDTISGSLNNDKLSNIIEDTTPQLGGDLDTNDHSISFDAIPGSDLEANGLIATMTVDTNSVGRGSALYIATDGHFDEADADSNTTMPCTALALETGTGSKKVLLLGFMRKDAWDWLPGDVLFVSTTPGTLTQSAPSSAANQIQIVGYATHADRIYFNPSMNIGEV